MDTSFKDYVAQKDVSDLHYEDEILNLQVIAAFFEPLIETLFGFDVVGFQNDLSATSAEVDRMDKFERLYKDLDLG